MKSTFILITLLISSLFSYSQFEDKINWEDENMFLPHQGIYLGSIGDNHYIKYYGQKATISRVDENNIEQSSRKLRYNIHQTTKNNREFNSLRIINNKLILFTSHNTALSIGKTYYMEILNPKTLETEKEIEIGQTQSFTMDSFEIINNPSLSNEFFFISVFPKIINEKKTRNIKCISTEGEIKWEKDIIANIPQVDAYQIHNNNIHLIIDSTSNKKGIITKGLRVKSILNRGTKIIDRKINLNKIEPQSIKTFVNKKGEIEIFGYYKENYKNSKNKNSSRIGGIYYISFNPNDKKIIANRINPLETEFRDQLQVKIEKEKKQSLKFSEKNLTYRYGFSSSILPKITNDKYSLQDGKILLIEQKEHIGQESGILYRKILISKLSDDGNLSWACVVPYYSHELYRSSSTSINRSKSFIYNNKLHIIYHDALANLNNNQIQEKYVYPFTNGYVADFSIDLSTGVNKRGIFFSNDAKKYIYSPFHLNKKLETIHFLTNKEDKDDITNVSIKLNQIYNK